VLGSLRSAWRLESARLRQVGHHPFHVSNHLLQAWGLTVLLFAGLVLWLGVAVLPWLLVQALYAITLLEVVNYLEHYGLLRQKDSTGGYERCSPEHSWNSNHVVGNILLYQLQRHSDHHANPARPYQMLRHFDNSPQLPSGYASMLLLAYVPPLWFAVMDKRVLAHYGGDIQRANVLPSARPHLAQRFSGPAS
jgi:alkane 1-monooxygenase